MNLTSKRRGKNRKYKITRYANIENKTKEKYDNIVKLCIEVTSTIFMTKDKIFFQLHKEQKY